MLLAASLSLLAVSIGAYALMLDRLLTEPPGLRTGIVGTPGRVFALDGLQSLGSGLAVAGVWLSSGLWPTAGVCVFALAVRTLIRSRIKAKAAAKIKAEVRQNWHVDGAPPPPEESVEEVVRQLLRGRMEN